MYKSYFLHIVIDIFLIIFAVTLWKYYIIPHLSDLHKYGSSENRIHLAIIQSM